MSPERLPYLPLRVACLGRYCVVYRPSGVGGYYAAVRCDTESAREHATFSTEAATRAWIAAQDAPPPHRPLGQRLRTGRHALPGLSVALLAAAVGVTPATIYHYEAGHHRPRRTTLSRLAAVLRLDRAELLTLAGYLAAPPTAGESPDRGSTRRQPPRRGDRSLQ